MNRSLNVVLRSLLRSPLHGLVSGRLVLLTVTGRRSGREYTFPVGFSEDPGAGSVTIGVGWPSRKRWWRNLRGDGAAVRLRLRGAERTGWAVAQGDEASGVRVEVRLET
jgi:hypothetical protein